MLAQGKIVDLVLLLLLFGFTLYFIWRANKGILVAKIQRLPAVEAIEEAVGRAVEMGRPIHYVATMAELKSSAQVAEKTASYYILDRVAELAAQQRSQVYVTEVDPLALGYIRDVLKLNYQKAGWPEGYKEDLVRWNPWVSLAFSLPNWFQELKPGANFMLGTLQFATIIVSEAGALAGAFQIGYGQTQFLMATCEYVLIGDEFFATSAYLSQKPSLVGSIVANDYIKMIILVILVACIVLLNVGIQDVIKWFGY